MGVWADHKGLGYPRFSQLEKSAEKPLQNLNKAEGFEKGFGNYYQLEKIKDSLSDGVRRDIRVYNKQANEGGNMSFVVIRLRRGGNDFHGWGKWVKIL